MVQISHHPSMDNGQMPVVCPGGRRRGDIEAYTIQYLFAIYIKMKKIDDRK